MTHCKYLEGQFLNEATADVIFLCDGDGRKIVAHKVILSASSLKFEKTFNENIHLKKMEINNIKSAAFLEFLYSFYATNPEKNYSMENIISVLQLARTFDAGFCKGNITEIIWPEFRPSPTKRAGSGRGSIETSDSHFSKIFIFFCTDTAEKFLIAKLTSDQLCLGYCIAIEFQLLKLEAHCWRQIDKKVAEAFPWESCINWVQVQCGKLNDGSSKIAKHLAALKHVGDNTVENGQTYEKQHGEHHIASNTLLNAQPHHAEIEGRHRLMAVRLLDTMLATQICSTSDAVKIELKCTKAVILSGVAFSTVSGSPRGKLSVSFCRNGGESVLVAQNFNLMPTSYEPRNFVAIGDGVVLKPNMKYSIRVELHKDVVFYRSRTVKNHYSQNDLEVSFECSKPDIFSHLLFNV